MFPQSPAKFEPIFARFKKSNQATYVLHVDKFFENLDGSTVPLSKVMSTIFNVWWPVSMFAGDSVQRHDWLDGSFEVRFDVRRDLLKTLVTQRLSEQEKPSLSSCCTYAVDDPKFYFHYRKQSGEQAVCVDLDPHHPSYVEMNNLAKNIIDKGDLLSDFHKVLVVIGKDGMVKISGKPAVFAGARQYHGVAKIYMLEGTKYVVLDHPSNYYGRHFLAYKFNEIPDAPDFSTLQDAFLSVNYEKYPAVTFTPSLPLGFAVSNYVSFQKKLWRQGQYQQTRRLKSYVDRVVNMIADYQKEVLLISACQTLIDQFNKGTRIYDKAIQMITQLPLVMRKAFLTSLSRKSTRLIQLRV